MGLHRVVCLILLLIGIQDGFKTVLSVSYSAFSKLAGTVSHHVLVRIPGMLRQAVGPQCKVHSVRDVVNRVRKRSVQIKEYCLHVLLRHSIPRTL